jgi:uncharacterized protein YbjT (DUF2867 family)
MGPGRFTQRGVLSSRPEVPQATHNSADARLARPRLNVDVGPTNGGRSGKRAEWCGSAGVRMTTAGGRLVHEHRTVLLVGATGRTGRRVLEQLLSRGVHVRAVVRSRRRLAAEAAKDPRFTAVEADLLSLDDDELLGRVRGCDAVVSCLGHVINLKGIFGPPRDLVTRATMRLCRAVESARPAEPVKFILMSSVSVNRPAGLDARRAVSEHALLWLLRALLPPARDNQRAADFLGGAVGTANPCVRWVVVRPDSLVEGVARTTR